MKVFFLSKQSSCTFFFEFPRGVRRYALTSASSVLKCWLCECFFRTRTCFFLTPYALFLRFKKPLFLCLLQQKKRHKNTRLTPPPTTTRERTFTVYYSSSSNKTNKDDEVLILLLFCFYDALLPPSARQCRPSGTGDDVFLSSSHCSSSSW